MREFATGATRDTDAGKPDYAGFLSPAVLKEFGRYMTKHQVQADGSLRSSDNWKKGMPIDSYHRSGLRHHVDLWDAHERDLGADDRLDLACAVLFNIQGYIHEVLKERDTIDATAEPTFKIGDTVNSKESPVGSNPGRVEAVADDGRVLVRWDFLGDWGGVYWYKPERLRLGA